MGRRMTISTHKPKGTTALKLALTRLIAEASEAAIEARRRSDRALTPREEAFLKGQAFAYNKAASFLRELREGR